MLQSYTILITLPFSDSFTPSSLFISMPTTPFFDSLLLSIDSLHLDAQKAILGMGMFAMLLSFLSIRQRSSSSSSDGNRKKNFSYFKRYKSLSIKDSLIIDMLESHSSHASWVLTDPALPDNPIVHCSDGFSELTKYDRSEIEGRNCRFLQVKWTYFTLFILSSYNPIT